MVRGHDHDMALGAVALEKPFQQVDAFTVEHAIGLVEQQQARPQELPLGDRQSALHAAGEIADIFVGTPAETNRLKGAGERAGIGWAVVECGKELEILTHGQVFVEMIRRRQKTDPFARLRIVCAERDAVELNRAGGRRDQSGKQFEQCRLAGAVGPEQGDEFSRRQIDAYVAQSPQEAISFGEFGDGYMQSWGSLSYVGKGAGN